jgi:uridine phosphorylase
METFHLLHLAACWNRNVETPPVNPILPPLITATVSSTTPEPAASQTGSTISLERDPVIRAAAAQLVFASRTSERFITPREVSELEAWTGRGVLEAVASFQIDSEVIIIFGCGTFVSSSPGLSFYTRRLEVFGRTNNGIMLNL